MMKFLWCFFIPLFLLVPCARDEEVMQNDPPVVKITAPPEGSRFPPHTSLRYKISVSDREDGESEYGEIPAKEVILEVRYRENLSQTQADALKKQIDIPPGLAAIESSNCFNCHQFNKKSTGPSFREIGLHYAHSAGNRDLLAKRIKNGSSGVWGKPAMPAHVKLSDQETQDIVQWIFSHTADTTLRFYTGISGSLMIREAGGKKGAFVLTANYTDHGAAGDRRKSGRDRIIIYEK